MRRWPRLVATCFVLLILLEIVIFAWVADHIGLGLTLLALIGSAAAGLWLIHHTGLEMVGRLRLALAQGQEPGHSLIDGACFVIAGMLLIVPGFFTDFLALVLILPISRNWLIRRFASTFGTPMATGAAGGSTIITDVEFREVQEETAEATSPTSEAETPQKAQPPRFEPQIFVPAKGERSGTQIRPGVIDVEPESDGTESGEATTEGPETSSAGTPSPETSSPATISPESGAVTDALTAQEGDGGAAESSEAAKPAENLAPAENLGKAPRRPIIDIEED